MWNDSKSPPQLKNKSEFIQLGSTLRQSWLQQSPITSPAGTKILVHKKLQDRVSWQFHGTKGWYIGPALQHYRCLKCYLPITQTEIISDTVHLIPKHIPIPESNIDNHLRAGINKLIYLLKNKQSNIPGIKSDTAQTTLIKLAQILHRDDTATIQTSLYQNNLVPKAHPNTTSEGESKQGFILPNPTDKEFK